MSGLDLSVGFDDVSEDGFLADTSEDDTTVHKALSSIDPRRRLEERLEEIRLSRELRELDFDYKF